MPRKKDSIFKKFSKVQVFFLGIGIGLGLLYLPIDSEFSKAQFKEKIPSSVFTTHIPTTAPLLQKEGFLLSYNGHTRNAHWVYHRLTKDSLEKKISREDCDFHEDSLIPQHIRASKTDYQGSGFDRGHLCPAADCPSQKAMEDSFFLSNITPQVPTFNRGYWKKLENHARELTQKYKVVHLFTGPLYLSTLEKNGKRFVKYQVIGKHNVAVPTHFFMLIFVEDAKEKMLTKGYILPNQSIDSSTSLKKFAVSTEEIESSSGILFTHILE